MDTTATGATPVPLSEIVCGLVGSESLIVTAAARSPMALGLKLTLMVQFEPAVRVWPQVVDSIKSPGFSPASIILFIASPTPPVLASVTV